MFDLDLNTPLVSFSDDDKTENFQKNLNFIFSQVKPDLQALANITLHSETKLLSVLK